jgi:hypothetical protein
MEEPSIVSAGESSWKRARSDLHRLVTGTVRFYIWGVLCAAVVTALTTYLSWGHARGAQVAIGAGALVGGAALALALPFGFYFIRAPYRILREDVAALAARVEGLDHSPAQGPDQLRVALMAVRTELAACGTRIVEALEHKRWWNTERDPLPALTWKEFFPALADPALPPPLHQEIEGCYQACDRLNHRINRYVDEYRRTQYIVLTVPASVFVLREGDEEALRAVLRRIDKTNTAISRRVDFAPDGGQKV